MIALITSTVGLCFFCMVMAGCLIASFMQARTRYE